MKKLAKTVWVPSASRTTAGMTSRIVWRRIEVSKPDRPPARDRQHQRDQAAQRHQRARRRPTSSVT